MYSRFQTEDDPRKHSNQHEKFIGFSVFRAVVGQACEVDRSNVHDLLLFTLAEIVDLTDVGIR